MLQFSCGIIGVSVSLMMVEFLEDFGRSKGETSWISTVNQSALYLFGKIKYVIISYIIITLLTLPPQGLQSRA